MPEILPLRTAVHEASHAVLGHTRGQFVRDPGLVASEDGTGIAHTRSAVVVARADLSPDQRPSFDAHVEMECAVHLGGYVAERRWFRDGVKPFQRPWLAADYAAAAGVLSTYLQRPFEEFDQYLAISVLEDFTRSCLRRAGVWDAIARLAEELVRAGGKLRAHRANAVLDESLPGPWMPDGRRRDARRRTASVIPVFLAGAASSRDGRPRPR
jgi:hypothetical protein